MLRVIVGLCFVPFIMSCGVNKKKGEKNGEPVAEDKPLSPAELCKNNGGIFENGKCDPASTDVKDKKSESAPNKKVVGVLSPNPGVIWEANETTCEAQEKDSWGNCEGIDALLPIATIPNFKSNVTIELSADCEGLVPSKIELALVDPDHKENPPLMLNSLAFGAGNSRYLLNTTVEKDEQKALTIRWDSKDLFATYRSGCKLELVKNSAQKI